MLQVSIIANADVYAPQHVGISHIVLGGGKVLGVLPHSDDPKTICNTAQIMDAQGLLAVPGFVDCHVHIAGGGGEAGPSSRTPESSLPQFLSAGTTTVVGLLGTDGITRSLENLVAKARALTADGMTAYFWTGGGYRFPSKTITGSVQRDLVMIPDCLGVGEVAISDHRSSQPNAHELARLAEDTRVGGMMAGKGGLVHVHVGPGKGRLKPLRDALVLSNGDIPISTFWPTHVNTRGLDLIRDAVQWVKDGGWADLTCGMRSHSRERVVEDLQSTADMLHELGHDTERCTLSTDAFGSLPTFGPDGELIKYDLGSPRGILETIKALREGDHGFPFERLIALATENPARLLRLPGKGLIAQGADADIVLLDPESLDVKYVYTRGEIVKTPEWVRGGLFDTGPGVRPRSPPYV